MFILSLLYHHLISRRIVARSRCYIVLPAGGQVFQHMLPSAPITAHLWYHPHLQMWTLEKMNQNLKKPICIHKTVGDNTTTAYIMTWSQWSNHMLLSFWGAPGTHSAASLSCVYIEKLPVAINLTVKQWQEATQPCDMYELGGSRAAPALR